MAERVLSLVGDCAPLLTTNEFLAGEIAQTLRDLLATHVSNRLERSGPEDLAEDRCILEKALLFGWEQIEPRGNDPLHRLRQLVIRRTTLCRHAYELLGIQGIAAGTCEERCLRVCI